MHSYEQIQNILQLPSVKKNNKLTILSMKEQEKKSKPMKIHFISDASQPFSQNTLIGQNKETNKNNQKTQ